MTITTPAAVRAEVERAYPGLVPFELNNAALRRRGGAFGVLAVVELVAGHPLDAVLDLAFALSMARICRLAKQAGVAP